MKRPWHETWWVGLGLLIFGLLAYGWTEEPSTNFLVGTIPFWAGVVILVRAGIARHRAKEKEPR